MSYQKHNFIPGAVLLASQLNDMDNEIETLSQGGSGGTVLSDDFKTALLNCFENVAWINENGQTYYDALYDSLYPDNMWFITNILTGCTTSNNATSILKNNSYVATITANEGYILDGATVSITMGGNDVTNLYYSSGSINIPNVTGDLVITVTATSDVVSITAVFTQGSAIIYDTDSLDTLRQYLVVTATYADSTTATVTDYTLSGMLEVGTNTIMVSYGGKTDTFTVTVTEDTNIFNPDTSPDVNMYVNESTMKFAVGTGSTYHMTYVPIEPNRTYKITKNVSTSFRIGISANVPASGGTVLYTDVNHSGTEIIVNVLQYTGQYLSIVYAVNVSESDNIALRQSLKVEDVTSETLLWFFVNGRGLGKSTSGGSRNNIYELDTTARAVGPRPIENKGYVFTVTDTTKYQLAAYDVTSLEKTTNVPSSAIGGFGYVGGTKTIAWTTSDSVTTPFVWLSLKKIDETAFTTEELANNAQAVFTYTTA